MINIHTFRCVTFPVSWMPVAVPGIKYSTLGLRDCEATIFPNEPVQNRHLRIKDRQLKVSFIFNLLGLWHFLSPMPMAVCGNKYSTLGLRDCEKTIFTNESVGNRHLWIKDSHLKGLITYILLDLWHCLWQWLNSNSMMRQMFFQLTCHSRYLWIKVSHLKGLLTYILLDLWHCLWQWLNSNSMMRQMFFLMNLSSYISMNHW